MDGSSTDVATLCLRPVQKSSFEIANSPVWVRVRHAIICLGNLGLRPFLSVPKVEMEISSIINACGIRNFN